ncbi:MAG: hypothetical protein HY876_06080 [Coriobacteriales bacterium]|nr:hypothetical protein [Coriobacteriales bacterium]
MSSRTRTYVAFGAAAILAALAAWLVASLPVEALLGSRVKLPIFHGASTWVSLITFTVMGLLAVAFLVVRRPALYAWEAGLRWVSIPLWVLNTVLGVIAALNTWDFTGSKESPIQVAIQDPRLQAQAWLLAAAFVLTIAQLLIDSRVRKAIADAVFTVGMWAVLLPLFLDPAKRALHPDNPVLNSGWEMKLPFFGIVVSVLGIALIASWLVAQRVRVMPETAHSA